MKKIVLILLVTLLTLPNLYGRWGWSSHRFINDKAVDYLPKSMSIFYENRDYLSDHSVDPDTDNDPGYYHYIDIDYYPEFFAGTLPHIWQDMVDLYGQGTMEDNGLIPWVIEWWLEELTMLIENEKWNEAMQIAAELGHYVADSHLALHLTLNYNGQLTNNYGIHSRYETQMVNPHLDEIAFPDSTAHYWESPIDSIFAYIEDIYPLVDLILEADDRAYQEDPNHNNTYYSMMWEDLGNTTIWSLNRAAVDLASIWYTAWVNAGPPRPEVLYIDEMQLPEHPEIITFPNPFNAEISFVINLDQTTNASLKIFDINGNLITTLIQSNFIPGEYTFHWNGTDRNGVKVSSGVYLMELNTSELRSVKKITLLK
ncbi:MAG: T9SS type A sorting domain-containing protein [FCB group bacterium]|nr:T9SS type A sorting domain-containing protein [FCB group bacterium]MBL7026979.1 T9SS type A sorting domain-containing protein [Candidatus Neomarinimicrobiota bacterium]MBL7122159.1 T9SS type A sorting domain-containing protein [Candidatus Neomarinimicrobiota bacterium]